MSRSFFRLLMYVALAAMALWLTNCGSSSNSTTGSTGGSGSGGGSTAAYAAGVGGAGQTSSAKFLYAVQVPGLTPFATTINSGGTLTKATVSVGQYSVFNPMGMMAAIDPTGTYFYQAVEPGLWAFTINRQNGNLTENSASPYDSTVNFEAVAVDQLGKYVYGFGGGQVYAYSIQSGGQLTAVAGSPFAAATSGEQYAIPFDRIAVSQDDKYLYVGTSTGIFGYSINASTGALTPVAGSPFGASAGASGGLIAPATGFLYELTSGNSQTGIFGYSMNDSTGALTAIAGSPFGKCTGGSHLTSPASGKFLFGASCGMYSIDSSSGALTFVTADPTAPYSTWAVFDPPGDMLWLVTSPLPCFSCEIGPEAFQVDASGNLTEVQNSFFLITDSEVGGIQALALTQ